MDSSFTACFIAAIRAIIVICVGLLDSALEVFPFDDVFTVAAAGGGGGFGGFGGEFVTGSSSLAGFTGPGMIETENVFCLFSVLGGVTVFGSVFGAAPFMAVVSGK